MEQWDPTEFQTVLREFLERRGWSQNQLALASGISQAVINRWLQPIESVSPAGVVQPTDATLRKLAPVVGLPHRELMRMAGRLADDPAAPKQRPTELATFMADVEAGWWAADDQRRRIAEDVVRSVLNVHSERRPGRRRREPSGGTTPSEDTGTFAMLLSRN